MPDLPEPHHRLSQQDAEQLLKRAIELDALRAEGSTVAELERVAAELNVAPEAFAQAVAELRSGSVQGPTLASIARVRGPSPWFVAFLIAAAACAGGFAIGGKWESLNFWLFVVTGLMAIPYREQGKSFTYFRDMAALWVGYGIGWFLASGMQVESDTTFHLVVPGAAALALGWIVQRIKWVGHRGAAAEISAPPAATK